MVSGQLEVVLTGFEPKFCCGGARECLTVTNKEICLVRIVFIFV